MRVSEKILSSVRIPLLVPDLPEAVNLQPWLERIDATRWYTNFGPLVREFESTLAHALAGTGTLPEVVSLNTGSAALELGMAALDLPPNAQVLMPAFIPSTLKGYSFQRSEN